MGIRSSVILAISNEKIADIFLTESEPEFMKKCDDIKSNKLAKYWIWESIKWNDLHPEMNAIQKLLDTLQPSEFGLMVMDDDGSIHTHDGDYWEYDIHHMSYIETPFGNLE